MDYIDTSELDEQELDEQELHQFKTKYILVYQFIKDNLINTDLYSDKSCQSLYVKTKQYAEKIQYDDKLLYPDSLLEAIIINVISETRDYNSKEYIVKAFQLVNNNNSIREMLSTIVESESSETIKKIIDKLQISLTILLQNSNYDEIKNFIELYNNIKYNPENNLWFSDRHHMLKRSSQSGKKEDFTLIYEYKTVEQMEKEMAKKLIEYSKINRNDCVEFLKQIPQFILSENLYGNSHYIRDVALPQILDATTLIKSDIVLIECKHTPLEESGYCSLKYEDCRQTLKDIIRFIRYKNTKNKKNNQIDKNDEFIIE